MENLADAAGQSLHFSAPISRRKPKPKRKFKLCFAFSL
jgi:hypothetical protein